jgi:hypothetical protein
MLNDVASTFLPCFSPGATFSFDAVYTLAYALDKAARHPDSNPSNQFNLFNASVVHSYLMETDYDMSTGRIVFDQNQDRAQVCRFGSVSASSLSSSLPLAFLLLPFPFPCC